MKNNILKFRADDDKAAEIKQAADREGTSISEYIRIAVDEKLSRASISKESVTQKAVKVKTVTQKQKVETQSVTQNPDSAFERFKRFRKTPYTQY
ncbi:MAG: ribbon-helix-helix protein, CopG family [Sphingobacteriales bacterium]|nr:MAG: ribbon-helix-helix protein, CopG family [Sphingobacteriales bacterium]